MTVVVQDSFTAASNTALTSHTGETGASWAKNNFNTTTQNATVDSATGSLIQTTTNFEYYVASGIPPSPDYSVSADFIIQSTVNFRQAAICGRMSTTTGDRYELELDANDNALYLRSSGAGGTLGSVTSFGVVAGATYNVELRMSGTTIEAYVDGALKISVINSDIAAAGRAGLMIRQVNTADGPKLDNFTAQTLSSSATLAIADALSSGAADVAAISQIHQLTAAGASCASAADMISLSQTHVLKASDPSTLTTAEAPSIGQTHMLGMAATAAASGAEAPSIGQTHMLGMVATAAASGAEAPSIGQTHMLGMVATAAASVTEAPAISQTHMLAIAMTVAASVADAPAIGNMYMLAIAMMSSTSFAEAAVLHQTHALQVAGATSPGATNTAAIAQRHVLVVTDAAAQGFADAIALSVASLGGLVNNTSLAIHTVRRTLVRQSVRRELESRTPKRRIYVI